MKSADSTGRTFVRIGLVALGVGVFAYALTHDSVAAEKAGNTTTRVDGKVKSESTARVAVNRSPAVAAKAAKAAANARQQQTPVSAPAVSASGSLSNARSNAAHAFVLQGEAQTKGASGSRAGKKSEVVSAKVRAIKEARAAAQPAIQRAPSLRVPGGGQPEGPGGDDCITASPVTEGSFPFDNTGDTLDLTAPTPCDSNMLEDIWFLYTAGCTGVATIGSGCNDPVEPDTTLEVFGEGTCPPVTSIACSDDSCGTGSGFASQVQVNVTAGNDYLVRIGGWNGGTVTGTLDIACDTNDLCVNATAITDGSTPFDNTGATLDAGDPVPCDTNMIDDIWFRYTATCDGTALIEAGCNDAVEPDTVLEVFGEGTCPPVTSIACADDTCGTGSGFASSASVAVTAGNDYLIRLSGWNGGTVTGTLDVSCSGVVACPVACPTACGADGTCCINQNCEKADNMGAVACGIAGVGTTENSYARCYDLAAEGVPNDITLDSVKWAIQQVDNPNALVIPITINVYVDTQCPPSMLSATLIATESTTVDTADVGTVRITPLTAAPIVPAGSFLVVEILAPLDGTIAGAEYQFRPRATDTACSDALIAAAACGITDWTPVGAIGAPSSQYLMSVNGHDSLGAAVSCGDGTVAGCEQCDPPNGVDCDANCQTFVAPPPVPANDLCADAVPAAIPSSTAGTTINATVDNTGTCGTTNTAPGVWYSVVGDGTTLTAALCNPATTFDTKLSVFCDCSFVCVDGNDDSCGLQSSVSWCSEVGHTYFVLVHGFSTNEGDFQLDISSDAVTCPAPVNCAPIPPANDDCLAAIPVTDGATPFDNTNSTLDATTPVPCDTNMLEDIWFVYTATCDGIASIGSGCNDVPEPDTTLEVFGEGTCPPVTTLGCADDSCGTGSGFASLVTVPVTAGNDYLIRVGGFNGGTVTGNLDISCSAPPPVKDLLDTNLFVDLEIDGIGREVVHLTGTTSVLRDPGPYSVGQIINTEMVNLDHSTIPDNPPAILPDINIALRTDVQSTGEIEALTVDPATGDLTLGNSFFDVFHEVWIKSTPPASNCCVDHAPGVGCDDLTCETTVCAADPFCCDAVAGAWDGVCAGEAATLCGTLCDAGPAVHASTNAKPIHVTSLIEGLPPFGASYVWPNADPNPSWFKVDPFLPIPDGPLFQCATDADCDPLIGGPGGTCELFPDSIGTLFTPPLPPGISFCGVRSEIVVPNGGTIVDLDVDLRISHTWRNDLFVAVEHKNIPGSAIGLAVAPDGGDDNIGDPVTGEKVLFDDESLNGPFAAVAGNSPVGDFQPDGAFFWGIDPGLAAFDGQDKQGTWSLTVWDQAGFDTGTLENWSLHFQTQDVTPSIPLFAQDCSGQTEVTCSVTNNITPQNSVSCNAGGLHTDNSYWRQFTAAQGLPMVYDITEVNIGIEVASSPTGSQPIEVRLYDTCDPITTIAALPAPIANASFDISDQSGTIVKLPLAASGTSGCVIMEVFTPDGQAAGNSFFIGSNPDGETCDSLLSAVACGLPDPLPVAAIGFPGMHIVMSVKLGSCVKSEIGRIWSVTHDVKIPPPTCDPTAGKIDENEPDCGLTDLDGDGIPDDTVDGGCNSNPPVFLPIVCGDAYCGTGAFDGSFRDTDWYEVVVTTEQQYTFTVNAEFDFVVGLVATGGSGNCADATALDPFATGLAGDTVSVSVCLGPGTWWFFTAPDFTTPFPCTPPLFYNAELTCAPCPPEACCFADSTCQDLVPSACTAAGGTSQGAGTDCATTVCPVLPPNDDCANCEPIVGEGLFPFDNTNATTDGPDHGVGGSCDFFGQTQIDSDVWFCWTAPCSGDIRIETCGLTTVDTKMAVYDGTVCPPSSANKLACNDDDCGVQTGVNFTAVAGNDYLIRLGTFPGAAGGTGEFSITCPPPPTGACCNPGSCVVTDQVDCEMNLGGIYKGDNTDCGQKSYSVEVCASTFEDISATGVLAPNASSLDDDGDLVTLGWTFNFWNVDHTDLSVTSNGYITFGTDLSDFSQDPIPSVTDPNDLIAPYWNDWSPNLDPLSTVHYEKFGVTPNSRLVVQWTNIQPFGGGVPSTFQASIEEATGCIEYRYGALTPALDSTVGVENPDGTLGASTDAALIVTGDCWRFCPQPATNPCAACISDPSLCDDGNECTADVCDQFDPNADVNGCVNTITPGAPCGGMPVGACDLQDTCDAFGACPDAVASAGTICRMGINQCDATEACDGVSPTCPTDACVAPNTLCTVTNPDDGLCIGTGGGVNCICEQQGNFCPNNTDAECDDGALCTVEFCCLQEDIDAGVVCNLKECVSKNLLQYGDINNDGFPNADDVNCLLDSIGGNLPSLACCDRTFGTCTGATDTLPQADFQKRDLVPCPTSLAGDPNNMGDNFENADDVNGVLDVIGGAVPNNNVDASCLACTGGPAPLAPVRPWDATVTAVDEATLTLVPTQRSVAAGDVIAVDVFIDAVADLRTFQTRVTVVGGSSGSLAIEAVEVDSQRRDFVFRGLETVGTTSASRGIMLSTLPAGGVEVVGQAYLGTYLLRASADATGTFSLQVQLDGSTLLRTSESEVIAVDASSADIVVNGGGLRR